MKKKIIVLGVVFAVVLGLSIWLNTQRGIYNSNKFWREAGEHTFAAGNGDCVKYSADGANIDFDLSIGGKDITAVARENDGKSEISFSDGWTAVIYGDDGSYDWYSDERDEIVINDIDKMGLVFSAATGRERREKFYGDDGETAIGESVILETESGDDIYVGAEWFNGEDNTQTDYYISYGSASYYIGNSADEMKTVTLKNGASVKRSEYDDGMLFDDERSGLTLYQNERSEYLIDTDDLFCINVNEAKWDRTRFARFLMELTSTRVGRRGELYVVFLYALFYVVGAATLLFPQKAAFMFNRWRFENEPRLSRAGVEWEMISGVVMMALGVILAFVPVMIEHY